MHRTIRHSINSVASALPQRLGSHRVRSACHLAASILFLFITESVAAQPVDYLGVPGPIFLEGQEYVLRWSDGSHDGYSIQEYAVTGHPAAYTDIILVEVMATPASPLDAAQIQAQAIEARRHLDPIANYDIIHDEATGEVTIDFVNGIFSTDPVFAEWNAFRFIPIDPGRSLGIIGISRRAYGHEPAAHFLADLRGTRVPALRDLAELDLPIAGPESVFQQEFVD